VKSVCCSYDEPEPPVPGTLKIGSAWQFRMSSQTGVTGRRLSPVA